MRWPVARDARGDARARDEAEIATKANDFMIVISLGMKCGNLESMNSPGSHSLYILQAALDGHSSPINDCQQSLVVHAK